MDSRHGVTCRLIGAHLGKMEARPRKAVTVLLINLAAVVERADEGILPAVYFFIGRSLNATLSQLGTLTLCRAVVQVRREASWPTLARPL